MHHHEPPAQLAEHADGCAPPADDGTTAALRRHGAAEHQFGETGVRLVELATGVARPLGHRGVVVHDEAALDPRGGGVAAHRAGVRTLAEQQAERLDDHRLARTGLPGERREPRAEGQGGLGDHPEVVDAELGDHARHRHPDAFRGSIMRRAAPASPRRAARTCLPAGR